MSDTTDLQTLTVTIPMQLDAALSPNARGGWWKRHRAVQEARNVTHYTMRAEIDLNDPEACFQRARWPLTLHWLIGHGKRRRTWDDDNAIAATKPFRDQIADCLGMDDRWFRTGSLTQVRDPEGQGFVRVVIEEAQE